MEDSNKNKVVNYITHLGYLFLIFTIGFISLAGFINSSVCLYKLFGASILKYIDLTFNIVHALFVLTLGIFLFGILVTLFQKLNERKRIRFEKYKKEFQEDTIKLIRSQLCKKQKPKK